MNIHAVTAGVVLAIASAACATVPIGPLPQRDADFKLPARELTARFPVVANLHNDSGASVDRAVTLTELLDTWGEPVSDRIYWEGEITKYILFGGLGATANHTFNPKLLGMSLGVPAVLAPRPMRQYVWEKGEYRITGTFGRWLFQSEPNLISWEWARRDTKGAKTVYIPWLRVNRESGLFVTLDHSVGGDLLGASRDRKIVVHFGDNTEVALGWRLPLLESHLGLRLSAGYRYSGFIAPVLGTNFTQFPIRTVVEYQWRESVLRTGLGIVYSLYPTRQTMYANNSIGKLILPDAAGVVFQTEFRPRAAAGIGVRAEYLPIKYDWRLPPIDASSIGVYWAWYW